MIRYELQPQKGTLLLPQGSLEAADFTLIASEIDAYLADHGKLHGRVVVADGALADVIPGIANPFVHAQVRHFDFAREHEALEWINQTGEAQMNPTA